MDDNREPQRPGRPSRRWGVPQWVALPLGVGIGLVGGLGYGLAATPQYAATSYVMVVPQHAGDSATALGFAQAYGRIVTGSAVLAGARTAAGTGEAELRKHVRAATSPDAPMISVTGTADHGPAAAAIANAVATSLTGTADRNAAATGVRLLVFSPAVAPSAPSSPSVALAAAVGASAGGLLGALVLLVRPRDERDRPAPAVPAPAHDDRREQHNEQARAAV
ncbi:lipopolysaccharide biosynthesis protein [Streptomyces polygonati]|uniref:Lipopolysaccharide biosynthesis protein n=1 Tax=Streptomyces polygonati TaxID=1617087 RepID=A0ABV8HVU7_9ACTN